MPAVLYVDDQPVFRQLVRRWYQRRGVTIRVAADIAEAKRILTEEEIAGVFVDIWLGKHETGFELYAWIAHFRPRLKERVVFVTGDIVPSADARDVQALGCAVITKPFALEQLDAHVRGWLGVGGSDPEQLAELHP